MSGEVEMECAQTVKEVKGHVQIQNVCFSYEENQPLIEDLTVEAKPGQMIAIVGPTGCGKTTFINLLMRFYEPKSGHIFGLME